MDASGRIDAYSKFVITANPDSKNNNNNIATVNKSNAKGDISPPYNVASPICAESGWRPTSTAVVTPSMLA